MRVSTIALALAFVGILTAGLQAGVAAPMMPGGPKGPGGFNVFLPEMTVEEEYTGQSLQSVTLISTSVAVVEGDLILLEPAGDAGGPWSDIVRFQNVFSETGQIFMGSYATLYSSISPGTNNDFLLIDNTSITFQSLQMEIPEAIGIDHQDYTTYIAQGDISGSGITYVIDSVSVPEPATLSLLALGGLALLRRKK